MLKQIKEQPNYYISDDGKLFNVKGKQLFTRLNRDGYVIGYYWNHNKQKAFSIHREVAKAFIPNPENKPCVNHIDCNKQNNNVSNLEWVTYAENTKHASQNGLITTLKGEDNANSAITDQQAISVCEMLQDGYRNCDIRDKLGISQEIIGNIRLGRGWKHISCNYKMPSSNEVRFSEETVRWVCTKLEEGFGNSEICKLSTNELVTPSMVSKIRRRKTFKTISKDYNF